MTIIDDDVRAETLVRPQPLGVLDGAAGLILVPAGEGVADLLAGLAAGRLPAIWPEAARTLAAVAAGDVDAAVATLGTTALDQVNRFVLAPTQEHRAAATAAAGDDPRLATVVAAAAYASGLTDEVPRAEGLDGEFAVLALTVRAARATEHRDTPGAVRALRDAVAPAAAVGRALEGRVEGMLAERRFRAQGAVEASLDHYDAAIAALAGTDLAELRAGLQLERGLAAHQLGDRQPHRLLEAVRSYQSALMVFGEEDERFATAHMHLGIAILSMPMTSASDQVRLGVAVQSLQAALRVFRPETHPWEWSSTQMNLANALQYLPSTHRAENLAEAVQRYDEVLEHRSAQSDPAGYARVLANRANALAHLAAFDDAEAGYRAARELFDAAGEADAVDVVDRQLAEIASTREAAATGGGAR